MPESLVSDRESLVQTADVLRTELPAVSVLGNSDGIKGAGAVLNPGFRIARVPPIAADFAPLAQRPVGLGRAYPRTPAVELLSFWLFPRKVSPSIVSLALWANQPPR